MPRVEVKPARMFSLWQRWRLELDPTSSSIQLTLLSLSAADHQALRLQPAGRLTFQEALRGHSSNVNKISLFSSHLCQNVTFQTISCQSQTNFRTFGAGVPAGGGFPSRQQVGFQSCHHCTAPASASGHMNCILSEEKKPEQ